MLTYPPVGVSTMAEQEQEIRRSHSEQDLVTRQRQQQLARAAEFYTAVGPDGGAQYQIWILFRISTLSGKEIILRKYLEDQAGLGMEAGDEVEDLGIGFVSQALGHLEQEWGGRDHRQGQLRGDANFDDPEKLLLLVNYVRRVASYLDKMDGVDIIVRNQLEWPSLIE